MNNKGALLLVCILSISVTAWICKKMGQNGAYATAEELVIPPSKGYFVHGKFPRRYLNVKGSWRITDDKIYAPKSINEYECWEPSGECRVFEASVKDNSLITYTEIKSIVKWDDEKLILGSSDPSPKCREETIIVDLLTEEVTSITKTNDKRDRKFCDDMLSVLNKPRKAILIDPQKEYFDQKYSKK